LKISLKDVVIIIVLGLAYSLCLLLTWLTGGVPLLIIATGTGALVLILLVGFEMYRRIHEFLSENQLEILHTYRQYESLQSIYASLDISIPLPPMRGWAISPDFAVLIASEVFRIRPGLIVEAGSGVSTLITGYCLKKVGAGKLISLDHDLEYARKTRERIVEHGLEGIVDVRHAPLEKQSIGNSSWQWYDQEVFSDITEIDMLIIDGPPLKIQKLARYPALPLLRERLSGNARIILDDTGREDEQLLLERWLEEFSGFSKSDIETEKGAAVLSMEKQKSE
jgi:hypothetical protein